MATSDKKRQEYIKAPFKIKEILIICEFLGGFIAMFIWLCLLMWITDVFGV